jgi:CelD/BcsL family acetyltransferase involved in cellulose biosynthesis
MKSNPFNSSIYEDVWLKHYGGGQKAHKFDFLNGVKFIKGKWPGQYVNIGGNYTNGMFYKINKEELDYKGKTYLIYDVPQYLDSNQIEDGDLKVAKLRQYKGLSINIERYKTIDDVLSKCFSSSKSRYNFRRTIRQLEEQHTISNKMFFGDIERKDYDQLMNDFKRIMEIRFEDIDNDNTLLPMWDFYKDLIFPMVNESLAAIFVIYDGSEPIALSINFVYGSTFVVAMRTFDVNYSRLGIGNIEVYKLIEWCIDNNVKTLDFSKGESDYKKRWCDSEYYFERHVIYDSNSFRAKTTAKALVGVHNFKQYLRDKKINLLVHKIKDIFSFNN